MKYLLALFGDESRWGERTPEQQTDSMKAWDDFTNAAIDGERVPGRRGSSAERHGHHGPDFARAAIPR